MIVVLCGVTNCRTIILIKIISMDAVTGVRHPNVTLTECCWRVRLSSSVSDSEQWLCRSQWLKSCSVEARNKSGSENSRWIVTRLNCEMNGCDEQESCQFLSFIFSVRSDPMLAVEVSSLLLADISEHQRSSSKMRKWINTIHQKII